MTELYEIDVYGRVHGVGYRAYARRVANELGVKGWVKNCRNGTVKIMAQGDKLQIETFIDYLKIGPSMARVSDVTVYQRSELEIFSDFTVTF